MNFVDLYSKVRAHPAADAAGVAFLGVGEDGQNISVDIKFISRDAYASAGAKMFAIPASPAVLLVYYNLSLKLSQRVPFLNIFL